MNLFRLGWIHFRIGALNELQYRTNFFVQLGQSLLALVTGLFGLALIFNQTAELNGWSPPELLVVMGVFLIMGGLIRLSIQPNMERLMADVQEGTLDFALTKPVDAQVIVSVREVRIWQFVDVLMGLGVLAVGVVQLQAGLGLGQALVFVAVLLLGAVMVYCFWLMVTSVAFWIIRVDNIIWLFEGIYQAGRWPVDVYPGWLRTGLTFLVPIAFAVTVPSQALTGRLTLETVIEAGALTGVLVFVSRRVYLIGLRRYSGASA